ncbi:DNA helicase [Trifolium repens]|nr:DNA helicase [Trifolium repens]
MASYYGRPVANLGRHIVYPATFTTVLIPGQFYGEVPHDFCARSYNELGRVWHLYDTNGLKKTLAFNKHHRIPFLYNGWFALLQHYHIDHATEISFAYFGNGSFLITLGRVYTSTDEYPSFHSYSTQPVLTTYFDLTLTTYEATSSQLTLQKEFGDYVRSTQSDNVLLCSQHLEVVPSIILIRNSPKATTKLGSGWREFCKIQRLKAGDTIRFKFAPTPTSNLAHIRKI